MSSRALAQLKRLEIALRPGFNQRASLRSASPLDAWAACCDGVLTACEILGLLISDQGSGAALWIHWRKSSASKQFLALLKAISEAVISEADWIPAAAGSATGIDTGTLLHGYMVIAWTRVVDTLRLLYNGTQAGALWPALSDWLAENDNLMGLWGGLAWCCRAGDDDEAAISAVHDVVNMMKDKPPALLQHPRVAEGLTLALSKVLPKGFARDHGDDGSSLRVLNIKLTLLNIVIMATAEPQLWQHLHLPALSLWPYLIGALRRQRETVASIEDLQVYSRMRNSRSCFSHQVMCAT